LQRRFWLVHCTPQFVHRVHSLLTCSYCTAVPPKGTYRYSAAPTGTLGKGPVGPPVPPGTANFSPRTSHFCPVYRSPDTAGTFSISPQKPPLVALATVPLYILGITPLLQLRLLVQWPPSAPAVEPDRPRILLGAAPSVRRYAHRHWGPLTGGAVPP
jgi:hypothetical protein